MVILMRIDERMLHGQVALTWVNEGPSGSHSDRQ